MDYTIWSYAIKLSSSIEQLKGPNLTLIVYIYIYTIVTAQADKLKHNNGPLRKSGDLNREEIEIHSTSVSIFGILIRVYLVSNID